MTQPTRALTEAERLDGIRLIRTENVGAITFFRLLERCGSAGDALQALPELARRGGRTKPLRLATKAEAERELAATDKLGARLIAACEPTFPRPLAAIDDCPPLIAAKGHPGLLTRRCVAMVGARNAPANGRRLAEVIARDLGRAGWVVASGLARGIDASAHEGALDTGTVAVLAGGIDVVYPEENRGLHARIGEMGCLVAEMPAGTQPQARHFPRRNRIVSGLSLGVVVVEAAPRSGSLITARMALDQGREVVAVPGSPMDPRAQGANDLIRQGATLTESAQDVLRVLDSAKPLEEPPPRLFAAEPQAPAPSAEVEAARERFVELLGPSPVPVDDLLRRCQLSPPAVHELILELEAAGRAQRLPGNRVVLLPDT